MCDVRKYSDMYKDMKMLQPEDTLQLVMEAKDEDSANASSRCGFSPKKFSKISSFMQT